ncbi:hypothetical protein BU16DRAFT_554160 [Lophium mytilinum]|uniref:Uncharacterized protein n=1 Tax=Lophium mytilinum TaxID=390894 RepID=A0A6A6RED4_9PEZI|nr:hypothetical protein BU16DRAFT_554160 [Lophium mytilinum]
MSGLTVWALETLRRDSAEASFRVMGRLQRLYLVAMTPKSMYMDGQGKRTDFRPQSIWKKALKDEGEYALPFGSTQQYWKTFNNCQRPGGGGRFFPAELVLLPMGILGPEALVLGNIKKDARSNITTPPGKYSTNIPGFYKQSRELQHRQATSSSSNLTLLEMLASEGPRTADEAPMEPSPSICQRATTAYEWPSGSMNKPQQTVLSERVNITKRRIPTLFEIL